MSRRRKTTGRYEVGKASFPVLGAAIAYALHVAGRDDNPATLYVRETGVGRALGHVERHPDGSRVWYPAS